MLYKKNYWVVALIFLVLMFGVGAGSEFNLPLTDVLNDSNGVSIDANNDGIIDNAFIAASAGDTFFKYNNESSQGGLNVSADGNFSITGCAEGQIQKYTSDVWTCSTDATGSGGDHTNLTGDELIRLTGNASGVNTSDNIKDLGFNTTVQLDDRYAASGAVGGAHTNLTQDDIANFGFFNESNNVTINDTSGDYDSEKVNFWGASPSEILGDSLQNIIIFLINRMTTINSSTNIISLIGDHTNLTDQDLIDKVGNATAVNTTQNLESLLNNTYVNRAGDNFTGSINMSNNNIDGAQNITAVLYLGDGQQLTLANISNSRFKSIQEVQNIFHSSGVFNDNITVGFISLNDDNTFNVTGGSGTIRGENNATSTLFFFDWSESNDIAIALDEVIYVGIEHNTGAPQIVTKSSNTWNMQMEFPLGSVIRDISGVHLQREDHGVGDHANNMIQRLFDTSPFARDNRGGGLIIGANGLNITVTSGVIWEKLNKFSITSIDTGGSDRFDRYYRNGTGGWFAQTGIDQWNNTHFDDGTGTLNALSNNKWSVEWVYLSVDGEIVTLFGQTEANSQGAAEGLSPPTTVPDRIAIHARLIGRIIFEQAATVAGAVESVFTTTFTVAGVVDHGNLAGLSDDDHTQYVLEDGTRSMSANWNIGSFNVGIGAVGPQVQFTVNNSKGSVNITDGNVNISGSYFGDGSQLLGIPTGGHTNLTGDELIRLVGNASGVNTSENIIKLIGNHTNTTDTYFKYNNISSQGGLNVSADGNFSIIGCGSTEILKYQNDRWECAADATGGAGGFIDWNYTTGDGKEGGLSITDNENLTFLSGNDISMSASGNTLTIVNTLGEHRNISGNEIIRLVGNATGVNTTANIELLGFITGQHTNLTGDELIRLTGNASGVNTSDNIKDLGFNTTAQLDDRYAASGAIGGDHTNLTQDDIANFGFFNESGNVTINDTAGDYDSEKVNFWGLDTNWIGLSVQVIFDLISSKFTDINTTANIESLGFVTGDHTNLTGDELIRLVGNASGVNTSENIIKLIGNHTNTTDTFFKYSNISGQGGLNVSADGNFSIIGCAEGEIQKYTSDVWTCSADATGSGGDHTNLTGNDLIRLVGNASGVNTTANIQDLGFVTGGHTNLTGDELIRLVGNATGLNESLGDIGPNVSRNELNITSLRGQVINALTNGSQHNSSQMVIGTASMTGNDGDLNISRDLRIGGAIYINSTSTTRLNSSGLIFGGGG